jgi:hypothetical protein
MTPVIEEHETTGWVERDRPHAQCHAVGIQRLLEPIRTGSSIDGSANAVPCHQPVPMAARTHP